MINFDLNTCTGENCSIDGIILSIDKKLAKQAKIALDAQRFYTRRKENCNVSNSFEKLVYYREILIRKYNNQDCLCSFDISCIISKIKKLLI